MSILARALCLLAALAVVQGHLLVGQSVAWLTMIQARTADRGMQEAIASTFSGAEPCEICRALQDERKRQREEAPIPEASPLAKAAPLLFRNGPAVVFAPALARRERPRSERGGNLWQADLESPPPWLG